MSMIDPSIGAIQAISAIDGPSRVAPAAAASAYGPTHGPTHGPFPPSGVGMGTGDAASVSNPAVPPASPESEARFRQLLDRAASDMQTRSQEASPAQRPSAITEMVGAQDDMFNDLQHRVQAFQQAAPTMDQREMTAQMVQLQYHMADAMARLELGVGFAQGGKSAVQNLMKNQ
ncbi:hypothetical protein [Cupriavidus plantarum]|uniref:hypothetical protein n=1 Tax=Cupriavidus plantarum TaxID=942865 RepID=UPI0015CD4439|nr:hypothetical protein [Cupriavidus plantarum]NYI00479.1 type III secretion system HrpB2-like protein [Cupriavidus plantarum]CAG2137383.1 hypothetical protein LMG26296_02532 [Cupriavidus plantarum]SMR84907.1 type III secretion protein HrpB2 [Cupriavidus plantarum]